MTHGDNWEMKGRSEGREAKQRPACRCEKLRESSVFAPVVQAGAGSEPSSFQNPRHFRPNSVRGGGEVRTCPREQSWTQEPVH